MGKKSKNLASPVAAPHKELGTVHRKGRDVHTMTAKPGDDADVLRAWRRRSPGLQELWRDESAPVTAWEGVTFGEAGGAAEGRVVKIELHDKGLTSVPAALGGLTALTMLDLSHNMLTQLPVALGRLTALTTLDLSQNMLETVPAEVEGLTALAQLNLAHNKLTSIPAELGQLTALTFLSLCDNQLTSVPAELGGLAELMDLSLGRNKLESLPAVGRCRLTLG